MSHTPGPWDLSWDESNGFTIRMGTARRSPVSCDIAHIVEGYAECLYPEDGEQFIEAEANAKLMAASPDLLAACEEVLNRHNYQGTGAPWPSLLDTVQAAVAKAKGEQ